MDRDRDNNSDKAYDRTGDRASVNIFIKIDE